MASMTVPETTVHHHDYTIFGEDKIGPAGRDEPGKPIAISTGMEQSADAKFRNRVLTPNTGHHFGTLFRRNYVSQEQTGLVLVAVPSILSTLPRAYSLPCHERYL